MTDLKQLKLGFVPLSDAAPVIMAKEKGFFEKEGLSVELIRGRSWSHIRDLLSQGALDAAHILAPMVPASWLNDAYASQPLVSALALNLNGNAITVSEALYQEMIHHDPDAMTEQPVAARALRKLIAKRIEQNEKPVTLGTVFNYSSHNYALRYWLASENLDPDRDVRIVVTSPQVMVDQMETGMIDGFCVGEPWNSLAEIRGSGRAILRSSDIWQNMPEKLLGVRAQWAQENPEVHLALVRALLRACTWLEVRANRVEAAYVLSDKDYVGVNPAVLSVALASLPALLERRSLLEKPDSLVFYQSAANFPWRSHALWFLCQMARWGQMTVSDPMDHIADHSYLPDLYRQAAADLGLPSPVDDHKTEGDRDHAWVLETDKGPLAMAPSQFIDGAVFNPKHLNLYLESFLRHNFRDNLEQS